MEYILVSTTHIYDNNYAINIIDVISLTYTGVI